MACQTPTGGPRALSLRLALRFARRRARAQKAAVSSASAKKLRLDELLVARGLAPTRAKAKAYVMAGLVRSGTEQSK